MGLTDRELIEQLLTRMIDVQDTIKEKMVTRDEFFDFKSKIYSHIDSFVKLHETLDLELVALRSKYERLEQRIERLEKVIAV